MSSATEKKDNITRDYALELERVVENAKNTSSQITFYFEDRETNPLKNVFISAMLNGEVTAYHKHDFYEMNYVLKGVLHQNISGKYFSLSKGELLFMAPGVFHTCIPEPDAIAINILFKKKWLAQVAEAFKKYDPANYLTRIAENTIYTVISPGEHTNALIELAEKLFDMVQSLIHHVDLYENLAAENFAEDFLLYLTKIPRHEFNFNTDNYSTKENFTPDDIVRYINDNFSKISLSDTAQHFGYSQSQLHRILKKHTGFTFTELILHMRMIRARHYLLNTHLPIKAIASLLGIDSAEHFTRMFTKNRGLTPTAYREQFMRLSLQKKKRSAKNKGL